MTPIADIELFLKEFDKRVKLDWNKIKIIDPCAGGMTTALAAHATNREFICCELNKEFFDKGVELLRNEGIIC